MKIKTNFSWMIFCCLLLLAGVVLIGCSSKDDQPDGVDANDQTATTEPQPAAIQEKNAADIAAMPTADINDNVAAAPIARAEAVSVAAVIAELGTNISTERKVELLESLAELAYGEDPNVIAAAKKAIADPNVEVAEAALELLRSFEGNAILPAVSAALQNPNADIRQGALDMLADADDPQVGNILAQTLGDESEAVRTVALDIALQQKNDVQLALAATGIASPHADVKDTSVSMLEAIGDKKAVDALINGLKDQNPEFRETISNAIESLIDQKFDSYEQAAAWWSQNKDKYGDDLVPQDAGSN